MKGLTRLIIGYVAGITVFLFLIPLGLYVLSRLFDIGEIGGSAAMRLVPAFPIFALGALFMAWSNNFLVKVGKGGPAEGLGFALHPKTERLVTAGPYRHCRNPMVFGAFSLYLSVAIMLNSLIVIICLPMLLVAGTAYLRLSEEKRLLRDFGDEYAHYRKRVPMVIPIGTLRRRKV